jgi:hypothetical protein
MTFPSIIAVQLFKSGRNALETPKNFEKFGFKIDFDQKFTKFNSCEILTV